jgi:flagellar hook-associated protein 3 FlgL
MRVTVGQTSYNALQGIDATAARMAKLEQQMSSGQQITKPSDDPAGTVRAMQLQAEIARNGQYATNSGDALSWLSTADTAYSQIVTAIQQARTLVLQGLNTGTNDQNANNAIAQQLDGVRSALISLANTSYAGRPVFGGTTAEGTAYATDGTYVGDSGAVTRAIGPNATVTVSSAGPDVFGSGSTDLFATLKNIADALRTNPTSPTLSGSLSALDRALSRVSSSQAAEGAAYQRVQMAQTNGTTQATALKSQLSGIADVDLADLAVQVTTAHTTYQAALQTTAMLGQMSLLDFLR